MHTRPPWATLTCAVLPAGPATTSATATPRDASGRSPSEPRGKPSASPPPARPTGGGANGSTPTPSRSRSPSTPPLGLVRDPSPLRPRTLELYRDLLRLHVLPTLGSRELARLSPADIRAWH